MEEVLNRLRTLSADELRVEIVGAGLKCGPITGTTRALFEKKLATAILESKKSSGDVPETHEGTNSTSLNLCQRDEGDFGYGVGLNPPEEEALAGGLPVPQCVILEDGLTNLQDNPQSPSHFYAVCPGAEDGPAENDRVHVYVNKNEAMKAVKTMRGARFKIFSNREDAEKFAVGDFCPSPSKMTSDELPGKPEIETLNAERANAFKMPRTQDLTAKLRKAVEKGDEEAFKDLVWSNPRYLIGSGDNPTIVQEGCRYNVMHVAAKENQAGIAQLLLDTLENPEFMRLMYPDDQEDMLRDRVHYIVDLYLNTPDKAAFETPLHFACKFGCPDVVNVLCSHPDTDKNCRNKYNQKPLNVICERRNKSQEMKQKIRDYLEDRYYIPLLRAADNSSQPVIGAPWSSDLLDPVPHLLRPEILGSPKDPVMIIQAFAGPVSQSKAEEFRKMWKTPPRDRAAYFHHILKSDPDRGAERVGRELAHELGYLWAEYWEFLDIFMDLSTVDGLDVLEEYLKNKEHTVKGLEDAKKRKAGKLQSISNSVSVGAFLDDDSEVIVEDKSAENRQAIAPKTLLSCASNTPKEVTPDHEPYNISHDSLCSPEDDRRMTQNLGRPGRGPGSNFRSPISNLMLEFEKSSTLGTASLQVGITEKESEDTSSTSSEEYFTAEESDDDEGDEADKAVVTRAQTLWERDDNDVNSLASSNSSYKSLHGSEEDLRPETPPLIGRGLFIDGESPTKLDSEVLYAIKDVEIDPHKYPCINKWRSTIEAFTSAQMQSWPSPARKKCSFGAHAPGSPCSNALSPGIPALYSPTRCSPTHASFIHRLCQSHL